MRYLIANKRVESVFKRQSAKTANLEVHVDSDWAGDLESRRSTSGMTIRRGAHFLRHMSTMQTVVGLSSAEAEFYALTRGACTAMGTQSFLADWSLQTEIVLYSDSSAARAATQRKGLGGKLRHLQTRHLWLQSHVAMGTVKLRCVLGVKNPADVLTKALPQATLRSWSEHLGQRWIAELG